MRNEHAHEGLYIITPSQMLEDYDWAEAFAYAGQAMNNYGSATCGGAKVLSAVPLSPVGLQPFSISDIAEVGGLVDGENDGPPWRAWGRVNDGRWFYLEAGCDYTGWDCQAGGSVTMALTRDECIRFAMTEEARALFGITL